MLRILICCFSGMLMYITAKNGEWGSFWVAVVITLILLHMSFVERREAKAWNNRQNWLAYGTPPSWMRRREVEVKRIKPNVNGILLVCGRCGRVVHGENAKVISIDSGWAYRCPGCGTSNRIHTVRRSA